VRRDHERRTLGLSQKSYIDAILRRYGFDELKPLSMPMDPACTLSTTDSPKTSQEMAEMKGMPYQEAVGSLMYAALGTHVDIAFSVSIMSRFLSNPGPAHWAAVKRIFRYLKGMQDLWLTYGHDSDNGLVGYGDADDSM
jgi:hypothetical protein